jgi:hypothetical protein
MHAAYLNCIVMWILYIFGRTLFYLRKIGWERVEGSSGLGWRYVAGCCEYGTEHSGSVKCRIFLYQLRTYYFLRKDYSPWSSFSWKCCKCLLANFAFSEPCIVIYVRRKNQQDARFFVNDLIQLYFFDTFRTTKCSSSGTIRRTLL